MSKVTYNHLFTICFYTLNADSVGHFGGCKLPMVDTLEEMARSVSLRPIV